MTRHSDFGSPHDGFAPEKIDLEAVGRRLVERAAFERDANALLDDLRPMLERLPPELAEQLNGVVEVMAVHLGQTMGALRLLQQRIDEERRTRDVRLRLDPLPRILASAGAPPVQPGRIAVSVGDGAFVGYGWHRLEKNTTGCWRWAWPSQTGSVILPRVAGGLIDVGIRFVMPFALEPQDCTLAAWLDGIPVTFERKAPGEWIGSVQLPREPAATRMALVIASAGHADPARGGARDARVLGIGLSAVWAERRAA